MRHRQLYCREITVHVVHTQARDVERGVFRHHLRARHRVHRCIVDIGYLNREHFVVGEATRICRTNRDIVRRRCFVIEQRAVRNRDFSSGPVDLEAPSGIINQRECVRVTTVQVHHPKYSSNSRSIRDILRDSCGSSRHYS